MSYAGLTEGREKVKGFLGHSPIFKETSDRRDCAYFDVSWGIQKIENGKLGTWRHCIAYGDHARRVKGAKPGSYLKLEGWITTNFVYDELGKRMFDKDSKPISREYLIIDHTGSLFIIERSQFKDQVKQLSLVDN